MTEKQSTPLTPADYLKKILMARVYDVATESALERSGVPPLGDMLR